MSGFSSLVYGDFENIFITYDDFTDLYLQNFYFTGLNADIIDTGYYSTFTKQPSIYNNIIPFNATSIDISIRNIAFVTYDNVLWLLGNNLNGQLGINTQTDSLVPVQTICGGTDWQSVSCGYRHTGAIKTDGTLWMWGYNANGELGTNSITHRSSPVQTICGGTNWQSVSCSDQEYSYTGAIKTDGTLWMWGYNYYGVLGTNNHTDYSSPVQTITGGTNWKSVSCGSYYTGAIKTDGTLWMWGANPDGQLGTNNQTDYSSPVQTIAGGTNWKSVSCGQYSTSAIKTDGTLWMWGYNYSGQLGTNNITDYSSPVQTIAGGTNWKSVSCGHYYTGAIKTDGTLWMWGYNSNGELNTGNTVHRSSPVQVLPDILWKNINCSSAAFSSLNTYSVAIGSSIENLQ